MSKFKEAILGINNVSGWEPIVASYIKVVDERLSEVPPEKRHELFDDGGFQRLSAMKHFFGVVLDNINDPTLQKRLDESDVNSSGDVADIYSIWNDPKSPVRNHLIQT
jgi:hypothetical protein